MILVMKVYSILSIVVFKVSEIRTNGSDEVINSEKKGLISWIEGLKGVIVVECGWCIRKTNFYYNKEACFLKCVRGICTVFSMM